MAAWKRLTSFFKADWNVEDYPIDRRLHDVSETSQVSRRQSMPWSATVINWPGMFGGGNTPQEAFQDLRKKFERFKVTGKELPRPGIKVPIQFAASSRVDRHAELARDFKRRVLDVDWAWISDESSLGDFHGEETNDALIQKIQSIYGVNVSDITGGNLADIFDRIAKANPKPS